MLVIDANIALEACGEEDGFGRTYDAEYVALAKILDCRLVTIDGRLRRGADRLGFVIGPDELKPEPDPSSEEETSTPPETEDAPKG
jgi:hypothetical protein